MGNYTIFKIDYREFFRWVFKDPVAEIPADTPAPKFDSNAPVGTVARLNEHLFVESLGDSKDGAKMYRVILPSKVT